MVHGHPEDQDEGGHGQEGGLGHVVQHLGLQHLKVVKELVKGSKFIWNKNSQSLSSPPCVELQTQGVPGQPEDPGEGGHGQEGGLGPVVQHPGP